MFLKKKKIQKKIQNQNIIELHNLRIYTLIEKFYFTR